MFELNLLDLRSEDQLLGRSLTRRRLTKFLEQSLYVLYALTCNLLQLGRYVVQMGLSILIRLPDNYFLFQTLLHDFELSLPRPQRSFRNQKLLPDELQLSIPLHEQRYTLLELFPHSIHLALND